MMSRARATAAATVALLALLPDPTRQAVAGPAILVEARSGRVLYAEDQDHQWFPASLTKIMTAYLAFDALKAGRLKLDDTVTVSEKASLQPPSKLGLPVGSELTVDLALRALVVKSANDVAVMLAERIGGNEEDFVRLMNDTARRLGMARTRFVNANGLPVPGQVSSARDLARLGLAVLRDFPDQNGLWAMPEVKVGKQRLRSHNHLLRTFEGADGIKTGFICDSGFNVVASATRDDRRLIAVVLGEPSGRDRTLRAAALLDHGFETVAWKAAFGAPTIDTLPIDPAAREAQSVRTSVVAWDCGNRRPVRKIVRKKPGAVARKAHKPAQAAETGSGNGATPAAALKSAAGNAQPKRRTAPQ
ncbi:MAG: D-alanyl-D-alanine carboxypeptidase family protein [Hyphomicrobiaceae bacterium]